MALTSNRRGICALMRWGLVTRLFCACTLDGWALQNAGWISLLLGTLLCAPLALMMWSMQKADAAIAPAALLDGALGVAARKALCLLLCATALYDVSVASRFATLSAAFSAFDQAPDWAMISITIGAAAICCLTGANGVAGGAQVFRWVVYFFLILTWVAKIPYVNHRWLTPLLGPGLPVLFKGALSFAGMETAILTGWLLMDAETGQSQEGGRPYRPTGPAYMLRSLLMMTLVVVLLVVLTNMVAPATPGAPNERDYALERYLANGRVPIAIQFPVMFVWFMTQIIMVTFSLFCATSMLAQAAPKIPPWLCALLCSGASVAMALSGVASRTLIDQINTWRYAILTAALLPFAIAYWIKQRRPKNAQA